MKTVLITGASRGIGKAAAEKFLNEGWRVIGTSTNLSTGTSAKLSTGTSTRGEGWAHDHLTWVQLDLTDSKSIEHAVKEIAKHGSVDVLINNAGINEEEEDYDGAVLSVSALRKTLEVNLISTIDFTERLLTHALIYDGGHIISLGSGWGSLTADRGDAAPSYSISKAGLSMYTKRLSARLKPKNITVSILSPGWTRTDMGGDEAARAPAEPAHELYELATSDVPTGKFWERGKERSW